MIIIKTIYADSSFTDLDDEIKTGILKKMR